MFPITADSTQFISLDDLKAFLNITTSTDDTELELFREAGEEQVESMVGAILHRSVTQTVRANTWGSIQLTTTPVLSVDTFTASGQAISGYTLDTVSGLMAGVWTPGDLDITYTVGRAEASASFRLAALIIAGHMWETQRGGAAPSGALPSDSFTDTTPFGLGYSIPNRALELLAPHMLAPGIA